MKFSCSCYAFSCCGSTHTSSRETLDATLPQAEIVRLYDSLAHVYDFWAKLMESRATTRAIELADVNDGQNILEVGVGTGLAFHAITRRNPHGQNIGLDPSRGMLEKAQKRLKPFTGVNYLLEIGTASDLPAPTESIDLLFNGYMFDLIPYDRMDAILAEFKRVLKPGAKLIMVNMTHGESVGSKVYEFLYRLSPKIMGGCRGVRLADLLSEHGFRVATREYHEQLFFPSEVILAYKPS
jgi:ubiquinone/menaquinone biosynthesis C-methylase UbiE